MATNRRYQDASDKMNLLWFVVPFQVLVLGALFMLPFGFDKQSSLGLDFEHLLLLLAVYLLSVLIGLGYAAFSARWDWFGVQLFVLLCACTIIWLVASGIVSTRRPTDYHMLPVRQPLSKGPGTTQEAPRSVVPSRPKEEAVRDAEEALAAPPIR